MKHLLILLLLVGIQPAAALQNNLPYHVLLEPLSGGATLSCQLLEEEYADYRRNASGALMAVRYPLYINLIDGMAPLKIDDGWQETEVDYAARAMSDDIHDIPDMFTRIGKPYLTTYFSRMLNELDQRQQQLCGYGIR